MAENGIPLVFDKCSAHHTSQPKSKCNVKLAISQSEICHSGFWVTRYQLLLKWNFWDIASQTICGDPIWGSFNVPLAEMFVKCYSIAGLIFRLGNGCDSPSVDTLTPGVIPLLKRNVQFTMVMVQWPWDQPYLRRLSLSRYLVPTTQTGTSFLAQQLVGLISITAVLFADTHTRWWQPSLLEPRVQRQNSTRNRICEIEYPGQWSYHSGYWKFPPFRVRTGLRINTTFSSSA